MDTLSYFIGVINSVSAINRHRINKNDDIVPVKYDTIKNDDMIKT